MRIGPSLTPAAMPQLAPRGGAPASGRVVPDGLLPLAVASFDDLGPWVLDQDWSGGGGQITKSAGSAKRNATASVTIPAGDVWVAYTVSGATAGSIGAQLVSPLITAPFSNKVSTQHVARFASNGHAKVRMNANGQFNGSVEDLQVVDMTALLAQPSDIYIAAGQSLMAAESQSTPVDPNQDYWLPRCLYIPGFTNNSYGTVDGTVAGCVGPLQMSVATQGVSPALSFARALEPQTPVGRTVLIVACASGGSALVGDDAPWNPAGSVGAGGTLYARMLSMVQAAVARTAGSVVKGLLWAQGESDRSASIDTLYPSAFSAMLSQLRSDLALPTLPAIIVGPMPDDTSPDQPLFLQTQERLDEASGHATAIPGVHYVAREAGYLSGDGTHPMPEGNRRVGAAAAARFIAEGYT